MPFQTMNMPATKDDVTILAGGLDQRTPNLTISPGHVRSSANWECAVQGGYARVGGYERFDQGTSPSAVTYSVLTFDQWIDHPSTWHIPAPNFPQSFETALVRGATASGWVSFYVDSGFPDHYTGQNYLVIGSVSGSFVIGETITVPLWDVAGNTATGFTAGILTGVHPLSSISPRSHAIFVQSVADQRRRFIGQVPGSGAILGVVSRNADGIRTVYAFRNTVSGTSAKLYKAKVLTAGYLSTTSSFGTWEEVPLYHEVGFANGGTTIPIDGATLTKGAVTATVKRVVHEAGSWSGGTASGRLIITAPSGGNFSSGAATIGGFSPVDVTLAGVQTQITLLPNGRYEFDLGNFSGQLSSSRIYGCDGVNRCFEFDGSVYVPISTKATLDAPKFVRIHHQHLVVGIGSSILISGPGTPYKFLPADGGFETATGDEVAGLQVQPGNQDSAALGVFGRNHSGVLYGTSALDWRFISFATATGAIPYMTQNMDASYVLDDRGVMKFSAAQEFGNFSQASLTSDIDLFLSPRKSLSSASCVNADRNQIRLFFKDGSALYVTIVNGKLIGAMPMQFTHAFNCVWSAEDPSGIEETFAGSLSSGFVYQLDRGSSFDGEAIDHHLVLAWNFMRRPRITKRFRGGSLEVQGNFYSEFSFGYRLGYQSSRVFQPVSQTYIGSFAGSSSWDVGIAWDQFVWDGSVLSPTELDIKGSSEGIQPVIGGNSTFVMPFTVNALIIPYTIERRIRG